MKQYLTNEQKEFIKQHYANMTMADLQAALKLESKQIHSYARNCKLVKNEEVKKAVPHYFERCLSNRSKDYNVYNYLGCALEPKIPQQCLYKSKYGKYFVNQNYFNIIDNEWKAYWLGFIYADGYIVMDTKANKKKFIFGVGLSLEDKEHLEKLRNSLQSDAPIKVRATNYQDKYAAKFNVCNAKIVQDLNSLGCFAQKTWTLRFPSSNIVPDNLLRHFVRGYFDGDGCISINKEKRMARINIVGNEQFLLELQKFLINKCHINKTTLAKKQNTKALAFQTGNIRDIESIYKFLYQDANIWLDRKLVKFDSVFSLA